MDASTVHKLSWYMPVSRLSADIPHDASIPVGGLNLKDTAHYLHCYKDLAFGWKFAYAMARTGRDMPALFEGDDLWVYRAYLYVSGMSDDPVVAQALQLIMRGARSTRDKLHAILMCRDITPSEAANHLGMDRRVVTAYEKLFFNVLDRKTEGRYLAEVAYPDGRYVELMTGYVENEALGTLLMRSGYNNGVSDVLYMAGMPGQNLEALFPGKDSADRFEKYMMMNGYALGRNGFLNQAGMPGIHHARQVLQAIKQSGNDSGNENPTTSAGEALRSEVMAVKMQQARKQIALRRGDGGLASPQENT